MSSANGRAKRSETGLHDWAQKNTYDAVMDIVKSHYGAYGIGVEYAYTMVHGAPPTVFPEYLGPSAANPR
jgi:hypothetical protein